MALSLQQEQQSQDLQWEQLPEGISDLELAKKLQEEEDRRASQYYQEQEQEQAAAAAAAAQAQVWMGGHAGVGSECKSFKRQRNVSTNYTRTTRTDAPSHSHCSLEDTTLYYTLSNIER